MPELSHVSTWLPTVLRPFHTALLSTYFRVTVKHPERIPVDGPVILAPTHRSRWDTFFLYRATRRLPRFLTSHDEFAGLQAWFMRRMGAFPVNTTRPAPSVLKHCIELVRQGQMLVVFPEGNLFYYPPNQVHPIKPGAAWIALECQKRAPERPLPIIPLRLNYSDRQLKFGSRVEVEIREPIQVSDYLDLPHKDAIARLTADLQAALGDEVNSSLAECGVLRTEASEPTGREAEAVQRIQPIRSK